MSVAEPTTDVSTGLLPAELFGPQAQSTIVDGATFGLNDPRYLPVEAEVTPATCATPSPGDNDVATTAAQDVEATDGTWSQLIRTPVARSSLAPSTFASSLALCPAIDAVFPDGNTVSAVYSTLPVAPLGDEVTAQVVGIVATVPGSGTVPLTSYIASVIDGDRLMTLVLLIPAARSAEADAAFEDRLRMAFGHQHTALSGT